MLANRHNGKIFAFNPLSSHMVNICIQKCCISMYFADFRISQFGTLLRTNFWTNSGIMIRNKNMSYVNRFGLTFISENEFVRTNFSKISLGFRGDSDIFFDIEIYSVHQLREVKRIAKFQPKMPQFFHGIKDSPNWTLYKWTLIGVECGCLFVQYECQGGQLQSVHCTSINISPPPFHPWNEGNMRSQSTALHALGQCAARIRLNWSEARSASQGAGPETLLKANSSLARRATKQQLCIHF